MNKTTLALAAIGTGLVSSAFAQHTTPNSWTPLIGASDGFPTERSGRAIHLIHTPPVSLAMGQIGKLVFFGRSNVAGGPVQPHTWIPSMYWQSGYGTFGRTAIETPLDYEAFCCGQTLMEDGKIVITGSNFIGPYPQEPGSGGRNVQPGYQYLDEILRRLRPQSQALLSVNYSNA